MCRPPAQRRLTDTCSQGRRLVQASGCFGEVSGTRRRGKVRFAALPGIDRSGRRDRSAMASVSMVSANCSARLSGLVIAEERRRSTSSSVAGSSRRLAIASAWSATARRPEWWPSKTRSRARRLNRRARKALLVSPTAPNAASIMATRSVSTRRVALNIPRLLANAAVMSVSPSPARCARWPAASSVSRKPPSPVWRCGSPPRSDEEPGTQSVRRRLAWWSNRPRAC